jgi:hypothetical protein
MIKARFQKEFMLIPTVEEDSYAHEELLYAESNPVEKGDEDEDNPEIDEETFRQNCFSEAGIGAHGMRLAIFPDETRDEETIKVS